MSGAVGVSGAGSYLNSKQDTSESITVAAIAQYRTTSRSLNLSALVSNIDMGAMALAKTRATHVITSIVYGGNVVGAMAQRSTNKEENTLIEGNFSIKVFNNLRKWISAKPQTDMEMKEQKKLNGFNLDLDLSADFSLKGNAVPTSPIELIDIVRKSANLIGDGVPCELSLVPLSILAPENFPSFRELSDADLVDIRNVYDRVLKLENSRAWLCDTVEAHRELFPSFAAAIHDGDCEVQKLVQTARDQLRRFLRQYRSKEAEVEAPYEFIRDVKKQFSAAQEEYEKDKDEWRRPEDRLAAADQHGFPVVGVSAVASKMNRANKGMLAAILVPENANWKALMDLYGDIAVDIREWRTSIDRSNDEEVFQTEFVSIYADPLRDATLESLDDEAGTLQRALASARKTKHGVFVTYGRSKSHIGGFEWNVLNEEGWGIIINRKEEWRYVGEVHLSKPHGRGVMTYTNQAKYAGNFLNGQRDGFGEILNKDGTVYSNMRGVFIKNKFAPDGVLVEVTVLNRDGVPTQYRELALNKFDSLRVNVDRIGTVFGWELNQRFRLFLEDGCGTKVDVVGTMIDPKEPPALETASWNLEEIPKITAQVL
ncbi:hypothetical protein FRC17_007502 [Serendipita sp. 399]|nr:hypothetical protein FRC17_007502 [Serendipita sp. 399]